MYSIEECKERISKVLEIFKIGHSEFKVTQGPTVTLFEFYPQIGVKMSKVSNLKDEFASALRTSGVRVIAPTETGTIGIEVPNSERRNVSMLDLLNSDEYKNTRMSLPLCFGRKVDNSVFMVDLVSMPHLLVAGATGMGKSVGLNVIISSLINKKSPDELKLVLIDPKQVEFSVYSDIEKPYLAKLEGMPPIITNVDSAKLTLDSVCRLMDSRYDILNAAGTRNIIEYNKKYNNKLPYYVIVIDEYGDLIMQTKGHEMEKAICRIAQKARAVGIHMIISTQRPASDIVTGNIKANFPTRIAFRTTTGTDSRVILDHTGAEKLTGKGDMLYFAGGETTRVQCAYISTEEIVFRCREIKNKYDNRTTTLLPGELRREQPIQPTSQGYWDWLEKKYGKARVSMGCIPIDTGFDYIEEMISDMQRKKQE
jgi:S-DNA-T family DNA segregation ATPase FtsK/SpoIIIE